MPKIYLLVGDAQKGPYSEEDVQEMYATGAITAETLYWKEGMADWQTIGPRDPKTGRPRTAPSTIAPPRRETHHGESPSYGPPDQKKRELKTEFLSERTKPLTVLKAVLLILFFFLALTVVLQVLGHTIPDIAKKFEATVAHAAAEKK